jgi:ferredoxin
MPQVTFEREGKTIACSSGINLRKLAQANGINLYQGVWSLLNCRGNGLCTSCEVEIPIAQNLSPRSNMEEIQLKDKPLLRRLACQVTIHGDLLVRTHPGKWTSPVHENKNEKK